jgi:hypothetical protein
MNIKIMGGRCSNIHVGPREGLVETQDEHKKTQNKHEKTQENQEKSTQGAQKSTRGGCCRNTR